jgi:hypothetical protein
MTFTIDLSTVDTSYWRDHPNMPKPDWLWPGYHCTLDKEIQRDWGITCGDYFAMYDKQDGKCATCGKTSERRFDVDHDHNTGAIRGLLCRKCNRNLTQTIADYILSPPAAEFNLVINSKKVKNRDKRLASKRAHDNGKQPQPAVVELSSPSISAQEKLKRALESSR